MASKQKMAIMQIYIMKEDIHTSFQLLSHSNVKYYLDLRHEGKKKRILSSSYKLRLSSRSLANLLTDTKMKLN